MAIQQAFYKGTIWGNQDIVAVHYEHPAITSEKYALGLYWSWSKGKPSQVFQFLLDHADQDILELAKRKRNIRIIATTSSVKSLAMPL